MEIAIRAYCDGSGDPDDPKCKFVTLGACLGTPAAWNTFENRWDAILRRHEAPPLHMRDARQFRRDFARWTEARLDNLIIDLLNDCFTRVAYRDHRDDFYFASCTINLRDYRRAAEESSAVRARTPQALCTYHVASAALMMLPDDPAKPLKKDGMLEVFFDRGERFLHVLQKEWEHRKKNLHDDVVSLIAKVVPADHREVIGIQAADFVAWHVNRYYAFGDNRAGLVSALAVPNIKQYWDYERLISVMPDGWSG